MKISKKKLREIAMISCAYDFVRTFDVNPHYIGNDPWYDTPPELWSSDERNLWDAAMELENDVKQKIITIIEQPKI